MSPLFRASKGTYPRDRFGDPSPIAKGSSHPRGFPITSFIASHHYPLATKPSSCQAPSVSETLRPVPEAALGGELFKAPPPPVYGGAGGFTSHLSPLSHPKDPVLLLEELGQES